MHFADQVINLVKKIPKGKVATYGQIASLVSTPRAARQVGWTLSQIGPDSKVPWQRVINAKGMISIESMGVTKQEQAKRLQAEGVEVDYVGGNYWVDLKSYLWKNK